MFLKKYRIQIAVLASFYCLAIGYIAYQFHIGNKDWAWGLCGYLVFLTAIAGYYAWKMNKALNQIAKLPEEERKRVWQALRDGWHIDLP